MPRYATRAAERSKYPTPSIQTRFWPTWIQRNASSCRTRTTGSRVNCLSAISSTRSSPYYRKQSYERRRYRCFRRTDASSIRVHYGRRHQNHRRFISIGGSHINGLFTSFIGSRLGGVEWHFNLLRPGGGRLLDLFDVIGIIPAVSTRPCQTMLYTGLIPLCVEALTGSLGKLPQLQLM
jgi:hypothetical protein